MLGLTFLCTKQAVTLLLSRTWVICFHVGGCLWAGVREQACHGLFVRQTRHFLRLIVAPGRRCNLCTTARSKGSTCVTSCLSSGVRRPVADEAGVTPFKMFEAQKAPACFIPSPVRHCHTVANHIIGKGSPAAELF